MVYQKRKITPEEVAEIRRASNINVLPKNLAKLPPAPSKLGKAASSIGKGMAATLPILGQTIAQSGKDAIQQMGDEDFRTARMNQAIAQMDPAIPQARFNQGRYGVTPQPNQNLQRANQALQDAIIDTPINLNSVGGKLMQGSIDDWQYATKDLSGGQRFLADTGRSILENAVTLPLALVNPSLPLAAMGARATASKAYDLSQQGVGASEALSRGLVSGGIEALTEKIPLENVLRLGKEGSKRAIIELLKQARLEAIEESASYALNYLADKAYKDPNASFSLQELALSAAGGALSGGVMGGGAMAFNKVANRQPSLPQATKRSPSLPQIQSQAIVNEQVKKSNNEAISPTQDATIELPQQVKPTQPIQAVEPIVEPTPVVQTVSQPTQKTKTVRKTNIPAITFEEYLKSRGIDRSQIATEIDQAEYIGGMLTETTKAGKGKAKSYGKKIAFTNQLQKEYQQAIDNGEIATIEKESDLNWNNESDRAYARMAIKRANKAGDTDTANAWQTFYDSEFGTAPDLPLASSQDSTLPQATNNNIAAQPQPITGQNEVVQYKTSPKEINSKVWYHGTGTKNLTANALTPNATKIEGLFGAGVYLTGQNKASQDYDGLVDKYGAIPKGEKAFREVDVPKQTQPNKRTSQFVRTALEADATPESLIGKIKDEIITNGYAYEPIKDSKAMGYAETTIKNKGYQEALKQWEAVSNGTKVATKNDIVLGEMLYKEAANAGDTKLAMRLLAEIAAEGTRAGQNVQALRSLKKMTPDGQLYYIQKTVDNLNADLVDKYGNKVEAVKISEELADKLLKSETPQEIDAVAEEIKQDLADQLPASWVDKWNNWRYLSMLGNPRTHIRNIIGNAVFVPARNLKNAIGAGIEKAVIKDGEKTKAILTPKDKPLVQFAKDDFSQIKDVIQSGGKYNPATAIKEKRRIYNWNWLESLRKGNFNALEAEDVFFLRLAYVDSLAQWMKANNKTPSNMAALDIERGRNYAILEAQKATYRDASAVASMLNRLKNTNKATAIIGEGVVPFTKTPINILKRGIEYSPAGLAKGLVDMSTQVRNGKMSATDAIDEIAAGLSGTAILTLGAWLASMGVLTGGKEEEKRVQDFDELQGMQNYSLNFGDTSYTIDWMAPVALPLFVGAEIYKMLKEENQTSTSTEILEAMGRITEPMTNLSMLQGIDSTIASASYSKGSPLGAMAGNAVANYASQAIPTFAGQVARTIDGTRRNAYYADKNVDLPSSAQITLNKAKAKLPYASQKLPAYVDQWGRKDIEDNIAIRAFENFLSPGYISKNNPTETDKKLKSLYNKTGESKVLPSTAPKYFNVEGKRVDLTAKQHEKYAVEKGQKSFEYARTITSDRRFNQLPDSKKVEVISDAYEIANAIAKSKVTLYKTEGVAKKVQELERQGISISDFLITNELLKDVAGDKDRKGNTIQLSASKKKKAVIDKQNNNLNRKQLKLLYEAFNISSKVQ